MTRARFLAKREMSTKTAVVSAVWILMLAALPGFAGLAQAKSYVERYISLAP